MLDDRHRLYVEPQSFVESGGRYLLAGWPNYVFARNSTNWSLAARDSVFAVVLDTAGRATPLPAPIAPARIGRVVATATDRGRWTLVFAEQQPGTSVRDTLPPVRLWWGVTDGARWLELDTLPVVQLGRGFGRAQPPVLHRGQVVFATPAADGVAVFSRSDGGWRLTTIPDLRPTAYAALGIGRDGELLLAIVGSDVSADRLRDHNSVFLFRRGSDGRWTGLGRIVDGQGDPVHHPKLSSDGDGRLSWHTEGDVWMPFTGIADVQLMPRTRVQLGPTVYELYPLGKATGNPTWVSIDIEEQPEPVRILRVRELSDTVREITSFPSPFEGPIAALMRDTTILITGPIYRPDPAGELYSRLIRIPLRCTR